MALRRRRKGGALAAASILAGAAAGSLILERRGQSAATKTIEARFSSAALRGNATSLPPSTPASSSPAPNVPRYSGDPSRTIRTFYHPIPMHPEQAQQVELWKRAWTEAGWHARVLGLDDARRHADYDELTRRVDGLDWCVNVDFERLSYVRWIAYAADGPGYVSDFDVLPLDFAPSRLNGGAGARALPNGGRFTSHSSLLSPLASAGSGDEFARILRTMLFAAEEHRLPRRPHEEDGPGSRSRGMECDSGRKFQITDMQALLIVKRQIWAGAVPEGTMHAPHPIKGPESSTMQDYEFVRTLEKGDSTLSSCPPAVHFSGRRGIKDMEDPSRDHRLEYMTTSWERWRKICAGKRRRGTGKGRNMVLNLAAGASLIATVMAAMM